MAPPVSQIDLGTHEARVEYFIRHSVLRYGVHPSTCEWQADRAWQEDGPDSQTRIKAGTLLQDSPEIARENIHTAVAAGDLELVRDFLTKDPKLAVNEHSLDGWQPLMRLAYTRLPRSPPPSRTLRSGKEQDYAMHSVAIAELLLQTGADASGGQLSGDLAAFHALTGLIGGGEVDQPEHPKSRELVPLLLQYGAEPLDGQALYNLSCNQNSDGDYDDTFWYDLLWEASKKSIAKKQGSDDGLESRTRLLWREKLADGTLPGGTLEYLLSRAVPHEPKRVNWLLEHGADPNHVNPSSGLSMIEEALAAGKMDLVELLTRFGAIHDENA